MVFALLLRQAARLRVRRQTAGTDHLTRHIERNGDLGALRLVDQNRFAIGLCEALRRQRPCVFHERECRLLAQLLRVRGRCRESGGHHHRASQTPPRPFHDPHLLKLSLRYIVTVASRRGFRAKKSAIPAVGRGMARLKTWPDNGGQFDDLRAFPLPFASVATIPRRVRTSCSVAPIRENMVRRLRTTVARLMRRIEEAQLLQLSLDMIEEPEQLLLRRRPVVAHVETGLQRLLVGRHPAETLGLTSAHPLVAEDQHGLRQVERSETRIYRNHD